VGAEVYERTSTGTSGLLQVRPEGRRTPDVQTFRCSGGRRRGALAFLGCWPVLSRYGGNSARSVSETLSRCGLSNFGDFTANVDCSGVWDLISCACVLKSPSLARISSLQANARFDKQVHLLAAGAFASWVARQIRMDPSSLELTNVIPSREAESDKIDAVCPAKVKNSSPFS
jgi:hypothetical protein